MNAIELIDSFSEFKELKNIDRVTMMRIVEDVFRATLKRKYGSDDNVDVIINPDKGDLEIWLNREIVKDEDFEDEGTQIKYSEALKIEPDFEIGEEEYDEEDEVFVEPNKEDWKDIIVRTDAVAKFKKRSKSSRSSSSRSKDNGKNEKHIFCGLW